MAAALSRAQRLHREPCPSRASGDSSNEISEIVVTAEKTSEPLSKTPVSISAVSSATLEQEHITDYEELSRAVPNLSYSSFGGPGQANIEIRGVSSQAGSATTGIYLDDVPINIVNIYTSGATEPRFFDVDRIEVLRGPQGTLYGASSMGGTIHFVSNAPDLHQLSGNVHSWVSDTQGGSLNSEADSSVNLPLVEGVAALRVGALLDHESGWIDRNAAGTIVATKINQVNTAVVRATLDWHPAEALSIELIRLSAGGVLHEMADRIRSDCRCRSSNRRRCCPRRRAIRTRSPVSPSNTTSTGSRVSPR